jgi:hypothetical protein
MDAIFGRTTSGTELTEVRAQLARDEKLLWVGRPSGGLRLQPADIFLIPFSLMWGGFALFWESTVLALDGPLLFKLWGLPFVLVGLYMIFGRFVVDAMQRDRTYYGLTNRRAIIITGWPGKNVQSVVLHTLTEINLKTGSEGKGTINFGSAPFWPILATGSSWPASRRYMPPSFNMIPNVQEVYDLVQRAQADTATANTDSGTPTRSF